MAGRVKKTFLDVQCKEREENNRMGKTSDLLKKITDQRNISCKDRHNKGQKQYEPNRIRRHLEKVARIHRTIQKDLHDPDNHDAHLEPGILEGKVKWALGSIMTNKASGGDEIPIELFQIPKDNTVKVLHSTCQQI